MIEITDSTSTILFNKKDFIYSSYENTDDTLSINLKEVSFTFKYDTKLERNIKYEEVKEKLNGR